MIKITCPGPTLVKCECGKIISRNYDPNETTIGFILEIVECEHD